MRDCGNQISDNRTCGSGEHMQKIVCRAYCDCGKICTEFAEGAERVRKIHVLHTSGHADINTIDKLVSKVKPSTIVPVHTINPKWYQRYNVKVVLDEKEVLV